MVFFLCLTLAMPVLSPFRAKAQSVPSLAADTCVTYAQDGVNSYRLSNTCDYSIEIAFCSQPKNEPTLCLVSQGWQREIVAAKTQGRSALLADQALDLFACRTPGTVEILPSGMARCMAGPAVPQIAIMSAASLKNPGDIITDRDYPASAHHMEGTSRFDLIVGPDGKPVSCETTTSSGFTQLDKSACNAFLRRARFSPPKDSSGNPATGKYRGAVTWKSP
jgi:TonB family protein